MEYIDTSKIVSNDVKILVDGLNKQMQELEIKLEELKNKMEVYTG